MGKSNLVREKLKNRNFRLVSEYFGDFVCLCGGKCKTGLKLVDIDTNEIVLLGGKCAEHYTDAIRKEKKGRRIRKSDDFLSSW